MYGVNKRIFKHSMSHIQIFNIFLAIRYFENKIKNINLLSFLNFFFQD